MTAKITLKMLRGACREQREIFKGEWPLGAEATIENVRRAQELGLDLGWGTKWFTAEALRLYNEALAEPRRILNAAAVVALRLCAAAPDWLFYYDAAMAEAQRIYDEAQAEAWLAAVLASVEVPA